MRKTLISLSLITAVGSTLVAGGSFSVFNDTGTASGTFTSGSVKLRVGADSFQLNSACTPTYTNTTANMGSVNNNSCASIISVANAGTLPLVLVAPSPTVTGSTITDTVSTIPAGGTLPTTTEPCFVSTLKAVDLGVVIAPGANFDLHVSTSVNPDTACQNLIDNVKANLVVTESLPAQP